MEKISNKIYTILLNNCICCLNNQTNTFKSISFFFHWKIRSPTDDSLFYKFQDVCAHMFSTFPKNLDFRHYNKNGTMDQFNRKRPHGGMTKNQAKKQKFNENILSEAPQGNFPCQSKAKSLLFLKILILRSILNDSEVFSMKMLYVSFKLNFLNIACTEINETIQF